jgi:hypothetical protein
VHNIYEKLEVTSRAMAVPQTLSAGELHANGTGVAAANGSTR